MTKTKSRIYAALAITTALTAPALAVPLLTAPAAIAGEATHDFADLAAKVTPAVVNVQVTIVFRPSSAWSPSIAATIGSSPCPSFGAATSPIRRTRTSRA